jgi:hypothetical protein
LKPRRRKSQSTQKVKNSRTILITDVEKISNKSDSLDNKFKAKKIKKVLVQES